MKNLKKFMSMMIAVVMMMVMTVTTFAAGTGSITITPPTGTENGTTNTYNIYKVFDADGNGEAISYKLVEGKTTAPAGFTVDAGGNVTYTGTGTGGQLTAEDITAIAAYVTEDDPVATVTSTGTAAAVAQGLANGYYYITTSTGTVVTIDSTNPNAEVSDKNVLPPVTKVIDGVSTGSFDEAGKNAIAQVGTKVSYTATVTVEKVQHNYVFHDTMGTGLTYNNDVAVTGITAEQYTIETPAEGETLRISFKDGIEEKTVITIKYSATVNSDALTVDYANNTASVSYGDGNGSSSVPVDPKVYTAGISAMKYDGKNTDTKEDDEALSGAGFKLKNSQGKYYKLDNGVVTWVDAEASGDEHVSDSDGKVAEFTGLGSGTYTLVETTVPSGYNQSADIEVIIDTAKADLTKADLHKSVDVFNNKGTELPSTGGIGTTLFYVIGAALVLGSGVLMVSKKRMSAN